eukprot:1136934-Pelagomonas_calceolata.AAC.5
MRRQFSTASKGSSKISQITRVTKEGNHLSNLADESAKVAHSPCQKQPYKGVDWAKKSVPMRADLHI